MDWNTDIRKRAIEIAFEIARSAQKSLQIGDILRDAVEIESYLRTGMLVSDAQSSLFEKAPN